MVWSSGFGVLESEFKVECLEETRRPAFRVHGQILCTP